MAKFKPGDPVWARVIDCNLDLIPIGEHAAIVSGEDFPRHIRPLGNGLIYGVDIPPWGLCVIREEFLRPRRDDYQQHEGLGARDQLNKPIFDPHERSKILGDILVPVKVRVRSAS